MCVCPAGSTCPCILLAEGRARGSLQGKRILQKQNQQLKLSSSLSSFSAVPSIQRPEAGILLVRGQIRAASAGPGRQRARRDAVLQPGEQMRGRREEDSE